MKSKLLKAGSIAVMLLSIPVAAFARSPAREILSFSITTNVGFGNEVFIAGSHVDTGTWDPTKGAKLYWTTGNVWTGRVGVQSGTALDYKPVAMPNSYTGICNPANAQWMPPGNGNHLTTNSPAQPDAPYGGKTIYYHSGLTNVSIIYSSAGGSFTTANLSVVGPGRSPGEFLQKVSGIGEAGESIEFVLAGFVGTNQVFDHAPYGGYGVSNYFTSLDCFFVQDGNVFNYFPPATFSASRIIVSNAVSTHPPSPSRTMKIFLPRGYDQNTWKRYPVLYMHDGENLFYPDVSTYSGIGWNADLVADKEISQGRMREVIIVGLNSTQPSSERTKEYLPPEDNSDGQGYGDVYRNFLVYDVKAKIDAQFRTLTNCEDTLTVGSSMGGLISTYIGWTTNVFGKIGPFSPAYLLSPNFNNRINIEPKQPLRIFTETGTAGEPETNILPFTWTVLDYFLKDGYVPNVDIISRIGCGQVHNEGSWQSWLPDCYHFLLNLWDEPNLIAKSIFPVHITNATPVSVSFMTMDNIAYRLEQSADATPGSWIGITTSAVETLPWANRVITNADSGAVTTNRFYRIVTQ